MPFGECVCLVCVELKLSKHHNKDLKLQQDRQYTYNVILRGVPATVVVVEK